MQEFNWRPEKSPQGQTTFRAIRAQFGDGYTKVAGDGIHTRAQSWPLTFIRRRAQMLPIKAFLDSHAGIRPFLWTPPLDQQGAFYTPDAYTLTPLGSGVYSLSVTLVQFNLP